MKRILIVEDDKELSDGIMRFLQFYGYEVVQSFNGKDAQKLFEQRKPHIVLLDNLLPDIRGNKLCEIFKKQKDIGIIFLTALGDKVNILKGFESGADDYVVKPFDMDILLSRIKALLTRIDLMKQEQLVETKKIGPLEFNIFNNDIMYNGKSLGLTPTEYKIFYYLVTQNDYCTIPDILNHIYGLDKKSELESRTISVHIASIRKKLRNMGLNNIMIKSKYKKGYLLIFN